MRRATSAAGNDADSKRGSGVRPSLALRVSVERGAGSAPLLALGLVFFFAAAGRAQSASGRNLSP